MSESQREEFLSELHVAVISVATDDGRPPASYPIWYDYAPGGDIRINTGGGSRKAKLIDAAGALTVTVQSEKPPYQYVIVEGTVARTERPTPTEIREEIAIRYLGEEGGRAFVANMPGQDSVLYFVRPQRWITADFSGEL